MIGKEIIKYSLNNLWNRKARSFLTILSIFVGITTIFIFISFGLGLYNYIDELATGSSADKIIIQPKGMSVPGLDENFKLTEEDLETVEDTLGIKEAVGIYFKVAEITQDKNKIYAFIISDDPEKPLMMDIYNAKIIEGRNFKKGEIGTVALGYNYLIPDKVFPKAYSLGDKIEIQGEKLEIIGFYESVGNPQDDSQIYVTNDFIDELYPEEENFYGWIIAQVDSTNIDSVVERVEKNLRKERGLEQGKEDFFVQSFEDMIEMYNQVLDIVIGFVILIAGISVIVSAINTTNTMVTSVLERTKEIGTMKAIGAKNSEIFGLFLFESSFLGFVSGVLGVLLGFIISQVVGQILNNLGWGFLQPAFPYYLFLGCIVFATVSGAISGAIPALNAAKTKPVDALRYE